MIDALAVIGMAAVPVGELRFAIPWAVVHYGFPWYQAFLLALVGNLIPVLVLPPLLQRLGHLFLKAPKPLGSILRWRVERLRGGAGARVERYGRWALLPFVATPLPFTGAWTGCLLAWAMDIEPRRSWPILALGVLIAAILVTTLTELGVSISLFLADQSE